MAEIDEEGRRAYKEVYRIIQHSDSKIQKKIPQKFIDVITSVMSEEYEPNIDYSISVNQQTLLPETLAIMALVYRDYICSKEKKEMLLVEEIKRLKEIEAEKHAKYNPDNIFKKKVDTQKLELEKEEQTAIIEYKRQNFFVKILKKIKKVLFND
ncbi:MAG: hypothetical protein FWC68_00020 [Oscillospiraceae bacterium]|nr:hypothetical protein [Oscillospiraceae bacterium]